MYINTKWQNYKESSKSNKVSDDLQISHVQSKLGVGKLKTTGTANLHEYLILKQQANTIQSTNIMYDSISHWEMKKTKCNANLSHTRVMSSSSSLSMQSEMKSFFGNSKTAARDLQEGCNLVELKRCVQAESTYNP